MTTEEITERHVRVPAGADAVPGLLWTPRDADGQRPLVLIGHGRGTHKRFVYVESVARRLVRHRGWAVVALDAPGHGERRDPAGDPSELPPKPDAHQAAREWMACIDLMAAEPAVDISSVGYWGISMGTATGIALLATERRIRCAVLGLMHTRYYPRILADAAGVACPVLFLAQWNDSRVPRDEAFTLFDTLGSADKRLHAHPGDHGDVSEEAIAASEAFLAAHLPQR